MRYPKLSFFCTTQAEIDGEIIRDDHGDITLIRGFFRRFDSYAIPQALEEVEDWTEVLPPSIPLQVVLDRISIMTVDQLHVTIALLKEHKFRFDHLDVCGKILADLDLESAMRDLAGHAHDSATISLSLANVKYRGCDIETALSILRRSSTIFRGLPVRRITGIYDSVINVIRISADEHSLLRQVQHVDLDCTFPDDGAVDAWDDVAVPLFTSISASDWPLHPSTITIRLEREYTADLPIHLWQYPVLANTRWLFKLAEACLLVTGPLGRVELIYRGVFVADLTAERLVQAELQASREEIPDDPDWGYYPLSSWERNTWSDSGEDAWSSGTSARSNSKPYDKYDHDDDRSVDTETGRPDASFSDAGYDSDSDEDDDSKRDFDRDMMLFAPDMIEYETPYEFDIAMSATLTGMIQVMMRDQIAAGRKSEGPGWKRLTLAQKGRDGS